jgi:hypothetical protein
MRRKQMPLLLKLLIYVAVFAVIGVLFFMFKDRLF